MKKNPNIISVVCSLRKLVPKSLASYTFSLTFGIAHDMYVTLSDRGQYKWEGKSLKFSMTHKVAAFIPLSLCPPCTIDTKNKK